MSYDKESMSEHAAIRALSTNLEADSIISTVK